MTDKDLDKLCHCLHEVPEEELAKLDGTCILPNVRVTGVSRHHTVEAIRGNLKAIKSLHERLRLITWLYCWLLPHDRLKGWQLYRLNSRLQQFVADFKLHSIIAQEFCWRGRINTYVPLACTDGRYACAVTGDLEDQPEEHSLICLCAWLEMPYLAVRSVDVIDRRKLMLTLNNVLGGSLDEHLVGGYETLSCGFAAALDDMGIRGIRHLATVTFPELFGRHI